MNGPGPDDIVPCADTETTGLDADKGDRIRAIALVLGTANRGIIGRHYWLVDTEGRISSPESFSVHKIPDRHPDDVSELEALMEFDALASSRFIIMQNGKFDLGFLKLAYERNGMTMPARTLVDTMEMSKRQAPSKMAGLDAIAARVGVDPSLIARRKDRHDALEDCELTFEVWRRMAFPTSLDLTFGKAERPTAPAAETSDIDW